jgi:hypothetical protein
VKVQLHEFLCLALDGGELSVSRSSHFIPRNKEPPVLIVLIEEMYGIISICQGA